MVDLEDRWRELVARSGYWSDHNIELAPHFYTLGRNIVSPKLKRVVQIVADCSKKPLSKLRILDLGCLEGGYGIEFALHGASVVGIEGKEANFRKAQFVRDVLEIPNINFIQGDIRKIEQYSLGFFDVVLCLGVLYHIDAVSLFGTLKQIATSTSHFTVFDTHVSFSERGKYLYGSCVCHGRHVIEYDAETSQEEMDQELWGSLDNRTSFWPTKPSLLNLLMSVGYTSITEVLTPYEPSKPLDRITFLASKGTVQTIKTVSGHDCSSSTVPEMEKRRISVELGRIQHMRRAIVSSLPRSFRNATKRCLRSIGLFPRQARLWERPWKERHATEEAKRAGSFEYKLPDRDPQ